MEVVLKTHSPTDAKLYYALRMVPQWSAGTSEQTIERRMAAFLSAEKTSKNFGKNFPVATKPSTIEELVQLSAVSLPALQDWRKIDFSYSAIGRRKTVFHQVKAISSSFRDRAIETAIFAEMAKGERIMILAGISHMGGTVSTVLKKIGINGIAVSNKIQRWHGGLWAPIAQNARNCKWANSVDCASIW